MFGGSWRDNAAVQRIATTLHGLGFVDSTSVILECLPREDSALLHDEFTCLHTYVPKCVGPALPTPTPYAITSDWTAGDIALFAGLRWRLNMPMSIAVHSHNAPI